MVLCFLLLRLLLHTLISRDCLHQSSRRQWKASWWPRASLCTRANGDISVPRWLQPAGQCQCVLPGGWQLAALCSCVCQSTASPQLLHHVSRYVTQPSGYTAILCPLILFKKMFLNPLRGRFKPIRGKEPNPLHPFGKMCLCINGYINQNEHFCKAN